MSINESREFEAINQKTGERKFVAETECQCNEAYHRVMKAKAKKKAIVGLIVTVIAMFLATIGINGLEMIGWINNTFCIVLICLTGALGMFKAGYLWNELDN